MSDLKTMVWNLWNFVPLACDKSTAAASGEGWSEDNPTWGHCAVASLLVQRLVGGELLRISLEGTEFADSRSHYYNRLPDGSLLDLTEDQFAGRLNTTSLPYEVRSRDYVLNGGNTRSRYAMFADSFAAQLFSDNALFKDALYRNCLYQAYLSPCQKAGFGAVIARGRAFITADHNRPIDALCDMCEPECIRLNISSRTESMLGACGHAEEWVIRSAREWGADLSECQLYVAGITSQGLPWFKEKASFTCLRCAVAIFYSGLRRVWVPVEDRWEYLTPEECLVSAKQYALGQEKV